MRTPCSVLILTLAAAAWTSLAAQPALRDERERVEQARAAKDSLLRHGESSPIPQAQRAGFPGLRYFPVDLRYRVTAELYRYGRPRQIEVPTTDGRSMPMERYALLQGKLLGAPFSLLAYRSLEDGSLLVCFTDRTNGVQTYHGGRYVQVQAEADGQYVLDFNTAYNPYCAYSADYICPVPPPGNRLLVAVEAGELAYGADVAH